MDRPVWMYREKFNVKHLFPDIFSSTAICGAGRSSYYTYKWGYDERGLSKRWECRNCNRFRNSIK